ncbi:MAG: glycine cleavage system protein GcvH [Thermaerobacter sp.]|nr:glycine cleavage system protein GcvH [Thermaerobacter sp.]
MSEVNGCRLPEELFYWPDKHVWARPEADGSVVVGMTDVAQSLAGKIIVVSIRALGKTLARGKSAGTVESGKWVGTVATPVAGKVVAINETLKGSPTIINQDPYGAGWLVRVEPSDWEADRQQLATGADGIAQYREKLEREGISCHQ